MVPWDHLTWATFNRLKLNIENIILASKKYIQAALGYLGAIFLNYVMKIFGLVN